MSPEELRSKGDRFVQWFVLIFLFVHLGIILPAQQPSPPSQILEKLNEAEMLVERLREDVQRQLKQIEREALGPSVEMVAGPAQNRREPPKPPPPSPPNARRRGLQAPPGGAVDTQKVPGAVPGDNSSAPSLEKPPPMTAAELHKQLLELDKEYVDLERQKEEKKKSYSLPLIGLSLDEDLIFLLYPTFTLLGLMGILRLRSEYLGAVSASASATDFPPWVLPIPMSRLSREHGFWSWVAWNMVGLAGHFVVIYSILQFIFSVNRYNYGPTAVNLVFVIITAVYYARVIASSIRMDRGQS